jgi:hypothetical protein
MKKRITITVNIPRKARRAVELYSVEFNFRPKVVKSKKEYNRKDKHKNKDD